MRWNRHAGAGRTLPCRPTCARAPRSASTAGKWPIARSMVSSSSSLRGSRVASGTTRNEAFGASVSSMPTSCGTSSAAVASAIASTKLLSACAGTKSSGASDCCSCRNASRTAGHRLNARGVGATPWPLRRTSSSPSASRSRVTALLTAGCVSDRLRAARVRLRSCQAALGHDGIEHPQQVEVERAEIEATVRHIQPFIIDMNIFYHKYKVESHWY